ncbi:MAG: hypothetical protein HQK95_02040, partial [Nitrospirae bacterium]|nr:hypothetical protein [Nitrospirota bacterium]
MADDKRYIQDPKTGLFEGSKPGNGKKKVKPAFLRKKAAAKKDGKRKEVKHGVEFATPD